MRQGKPVEQALSHIIRSETQEEPLKKTAEHAKEHSIREVTPELIEPVQETSARHRIAGQLIET